MFLVESANYHVKNGVVFGNYTFRTIAIESFSDNHGAVPLLLATAAVAAAIIGIWPSHDTIIISSQNCVSTKNCPMMTVLYYYF